MKLQSLALLLVLASASALADGVAAQCTLTNIAINPAPAGQFVTYAGHGRALDILLESARTDREVEVFPEPPLILRRQDKQCAIDGGIWSRKDIYLDASERTLITVESSGSNDSLNFYDAMSCKRLSRLDISDRAWKIRNNTLVLTSKHSKAKPRTRRVNSHCIPS